MAVCFGSLLFGHTPAAAPCEFYKRLVKTPKLYFLDAGLMAWLLGIRDDNTLDTHASRGALFETFVVNEPIKQRFNQGQESDLYFWRDSTGHEVDVLRDTPNGLQTIEIKSGSTFASDWPKGLHQWQALAGTDMPPSQVIYGGNASFQREDYEVLSWQGAGQPLP